ncbi:MAG: CPBP family intramembrane metalloprotease [Eubacteriales bacterium]|nr:CPBP family intramembrane metalloprotease [Eubacteriales bacterium]
MLEVFDGKQTYRGGRGKTPFLQIIVFLLLAFLILLICVALIQYTAIGQSNLFSLLLFGVEAASPSLAAILTVLLFRSKSGLGTFLKSRYADHLSVKLILIGLLLPVAVAAVSKLVYCFYFGIVPALGLPSAKKMLILFWALFAEELGWRGFLQEELRPYLNAHAIPLVVGFVWALWHYHFFLSGQMSAPILLFVLGCVADSYLYFALTTAAKGNIVPVSIAHFSANLSINLLLIGPQYDHGSAALYLLYVSCCFVTAAVVYAVVLNRGKSTRNTVL